MNLSIREWEGVLKWENKQEYSKYRQRLKHASFLDKSVEEPSKPLSCGESNADKIPDRV